MNLVLLIDFGSTNTKVTAVDTKNKKLSGTATSFTTVQSDINEGLQNAISNLFAKTGKLTFSNMYACSSAAGGLKMIAVGLVPELTAEAARRASLNAGAKLLKVFSYDLNKKDIQEIEELKPDILLLTGGTDGGNQKIILHNANAISQIERKFPVIVAGNKSASYTALEIFEKNNFDVRICENVMPEFNNLNIEPAKNLIREVFLERIVKAKGLSTVTSLVDEIIMPTPSAVLKAAELLSKGYEKEEGIGELMMIDVGGATTDVYSVASGAPTRNIVSFKGLPEPYAKRTVEGDLGVRYSSSSLALEADIQNLCKLSGQSLLEVSSYLELIAKNPGSIPDNDASRKIDFALSYYAVKVATERHCGKVEMFYTANGTVFAQTGKDLTDVKNIVGTGGPIINSIDPEGILEGSFFNKEKEDILKPKKAKIYIDKHYILASMGLLSEKFPDVALKIMKDSI